MSKIAWAALIGMVLLVVLGFGLSLLVPYRGGYGWGMMGPWMMGGFGFPFIGGLMMLAFWVLVVVGGIWLFQSLTRNSGPSTWNAPGRESPLDILRARYAKGEITKEQYDQLRHDLGV